MGGPLIISVEGNIGSGKSTLVEDLKRHLGDKQEINGRSVVFLQEPVDVWSKTTDSHGVSILAKFYKDQEKYAFPFQMMAYISRQSSINRALESSPDSIIITERCVHTDRNVFAKMLHDDGKIEDINRKIYEMWFDEFSRGSQYAGHVYLTAAPRVCSRRIGRRSRPGEDIPIDYLDKCKRYHDAWLCTTSDDVLHVCNDRDGDNKEKCKTIVDFVARLAEY